MKELFSINSYFKKYLPIFIIMLSLVVLMGSSYALLRSSEQGENTYVMNVGLLEVTFVDSKTNALTLTNMIPMTDEEGKQIEQELAFTVKNTGSLSAEYDVYIEETSTNPEFKSVLRFISNKNDTGYNDPKTLSEDKYIDTLGELGLGEEATYKVKVWLDESADSTYMDKEFKAKVVVHAKQVTSKKLSMEFETIITTNKYNSYTQDSYQVKYISGAKDDNNQSTTNDIDFNYVWYSGKLWRIVSIYPDGTMKLVTEDIISVVMFGSNNVFYTNDTTKSYVYQWLNEDFLDTLENTENVIADNYSWNATVGNGSIDYILPETTIVNAKVGLLNSYEYYKSYEKEENSASSYLNTEYFWMLLNPGNPDSEIDHWFIGEDGESYILDCREMAGVRPSIYVKSTVEILGGDGTKSNPYVIDSGKEEIVPNTTLLNTRSSGEYVNFNNQIFRIIDNENVDNQLTTKLITSDYIKDTNGSIITKSFSGNFGEMNNTSEIDYYLNKIWLKELDSTYNETTDTSNFLEKGTYYITNLNGIYKEVVCVNPDSTVSIKDCEKVTTTWSGYVGISRYAEMFASQTGNGYLSANEMVLINTTGGKDDNLWVMDGAGFLYNEAIFGPVVERAIRPTINLKSSIVIKAGSGTEQDPFVVGLPE